MDIPCTYLVDIHGMSKDIPYIHGISKDIPYIHGISKDIPCISSLMDIHDMSKDRPCIFHVYVGHLQICGIYQAYYRHIPKIEFPDESKRC
jgi:hypothetical protein